SNAMSINTTLLTPELYQYLLQVSLREPPLLAELREETTRSFSTYAMQTAPEQAQLLALLVKLMQAKKVIDIGTFTGYSAIAMGLALPKDGTLITCDVDEKSTALAKEYWEKAGLSDKIGLRLSPAKDTLAELIHAGQAWQYDLIYIDADKANTDLYYEESLKLLREGGLIAVDNVLRRGQVADEENQSENNQLIRLFNQKVYKDERVDMILIPIGDGLTLARKKS
uniref:O-methyltransferase n=1 Tax=Coxiella burnetii TaxID=777 RepID=UPI00022A9A79